MSKLLNANGIRVSAAILEAARHLVPLYLETHPDQMRTLVEDGVVLEQQIVGNGRDYELLNRKTVCGMVVVDDTSMPRDQMVLRDATGYELVRIVNVAVPVTNSRKEQ